MNEQFNSIATIIRERRTIKPGQMNGQEIPDETAKEILALADWAPTHGGTEPWRFFVYAGNEKVREFCAAHAALYKSETAEENFNPTSFTNFERMGDNASHVFIAVMQRGGNEKIPVLEEIASASASITNVLLGAAAQGVAAYWGSGGMVLKPAMKTMLGLREEDIVLGAIYLGYTDAAKAGSRKVPVSEKIKWM